MELGGLELADLLGAICRRIYALVASQPYSGAQTAFFSFDMTLETCAPLCFRELERHPAHRGELRHDDPLPKEQTFAADRGDCEHWVAASLEEGLRFF